METPGAVCCPAGNGTGTEIERKSRHLITWQTPKTEASAGTERL
jgi:hypothetical protein